MEYDQIKQNIESIFTGLKLSGHNTKDAQLYILNNLNEIVLNLDGKYIKCNKSKQCDNCGANNYVAGEKSHNTTIYIVETEELKGLYCNVCCFMPK